MMMERVSRAASEAAVKAALSHKRSRDGDDDDADQKGKRHQQQHSRFDADTSAAMAMDEDGDAAVSVLKVDRLQRANEDRAMRAAIMRSLNRPDSDRSLYPTAMPVAVPSSLPSAAIVSLTSSAPSAGLSGAALIANAASSAASNGGVSALSATQAVVNWCVAPIAVVPPFCLHFPFRRVDKDNKAAKELALAVASGAAIKVIESFGRKALQGSKGASCVELVLQSAFYDREEKKSPYGRALEWNSAMLRYVDAVGVVDPSQVAGLREYARFIGDMACVVDFTALEAADWQWRQKCANTGMPINHYGEAWELFSRVPRIAADERAAHVPRQQQQQHRGEGSGQRHRGRGGNAFASASVAAASSAAASSAPSAPTTAPRKGACYRYNAEQACAETPCPFRHVCNRRSCRSADAQHSAVRCPKRQQPPASSSGG